MSLDEKYISQFAKITSKAAISTIPYLGKKDKKAADKAAVDNMRSEVNKINIVNNPMFLNINFIKTFLNIIQFF